MRSAMSPGSSPHCSRSPPTQARTVALSRTEDIPSPVILSAEAIERGSRPLREGIWSGRRGANGTFARGQHLLHRKIQPLGQLQNLLPAPWQWRRGRDHLACPQLLDHSRVALERRVYVTFVVQLLERRPRPLASRLPRLRRIADKHYPQRHPIVWDAEDLLREHRVRRIQAGAEAFVESREKRVLSGASAVGHRRSHVSLKSVRHRLENLRVHELIDELVAPAMRRRQRARIH